jgi:hypothetical protein
MTMLDFGSLGLILKMGRLVGIGTSAEAKERAQLVNGVTDRLEAVAAAIRGTSSQSLPHLCALLEGYGTVGAGQLSAALKQANIAKITRRFGRSPGLSASRTRAGGHRRPASRRSAQSMARAANSPGPPVSCRSTPDSTASRASSKS